MGWFSSRKDRNRQSAGKVYAGSHRSPGLEVICHFLETEPAYAVLDLGTSSNESMELMNELCDDLVVQDVFHSSSARKGVRSEIFQFEDARDIALPPADQTFDVMLLWDLLHYVPAQERPVLVERLARRCNKNAMVLITASAIAEIPPEPIHFKMLRHDRVEYVCSDERAPSPGLNTRVVEKVMAPFQPVRIFQLRNGLQEMVFQMVEPPGPNSSGRGTGAVASPASLASGTAVPSSAKSPLAVPSTTVASTKVPSTTISSTKGSTAPSSPETGAVTALDDSPAALLDADSAASPSASDGPQVAGSYEPMLDLRAPGPESETEASAEDENRSGGQGSSSRAGKGRSRSRRRRR